MWYSAELCSANQRRSWVRCPFPELKSWMDGRLPPACQLQDSAPRLACSFTVTSFHFTSSCKTENLQLHMKLPCYLSNGATSKQSRIHGARGFHLGPGTRHQTRLNLQHHRQKPGRCSVCLLYLHASCRSETRPPLNARHLLLFESSRAP